MSGSYASPPYPPTTASLGLQPTVSVDVPICSVFLFLFILGAACHMTILQVNLKRGHKFIISGMLFGFCMARITTMVMRIASATRPTNLRIAIAANVFVYAGVLLLFIVNLMFAQRIVRACHPKTAWHPLFHHLFTAIYGLIVLSLIMLIVSVIQSVYTLNGHTRYIDRAILLYGQTFYTVISFLPILMVIGGLIIPRKTRVEKFGQGHFRAKIAILLTSSFLLCLGACYRTGVNYADGDRPIRDPSKAQGKAPFYIVNFGIEIIVVLLYVIVRVDRRFHVPDRSKGPGDYSRGRAATTGRKEQSAKSSGEENIGIMIAPEEVVLDDMTPQEVVRSTTKETKTDEDAAIPCDGNTSISLPVQPSGAGTWHEKGLVPP